MKKQHTRKNQAGFSLIELAIVLVVMGLLIGGALKGRELVESARLKRAIAQLTEYKLATNTFIDRYDALPGDFENARGMIHPNVRNGNGNGVIEGGGLLSGGEALSFWSHLAHAGLISTPGPQGEEDRGEFGKGAPACSLGGGFTVETNPHGLKGLWFILGQKRGDHGDGALLTPAQAFSIDKRIDNGYPSSGRVRAFDGRDASERSCVTEGGTYNLENQEVACVLLFQF